MIDSSPDRAKTPLAPGLKQIGTIRPGLTLEDGTRIYHAGDTATITGVGTGAGVPWSRFWVVMGVAGLVIGALLYALLPARRVPLSCAFWGGLFAALGYKHNVWPMQCLAETRSRWTRGAAAGRVAA